MAWAALTHRLYSQWRDHGLQGHRLLVLCSGGSDSTALAYLAHQISRPLGFCVTLGHCHHGHNGRSFREDAQEFVHQFASHLGISCLTKQSPVELKSEEEMRAFRQSCAEEWIKENKFDRVLIAHHADDLLETRFFRLLRGTGLQGLESMKEWESPVWRPFLSVTKKEIEEFLEWNRLRCLVDPTNLGNENRRSWLRNEIFPAFEREMPGALENLAKSLSRAVDAFDEQDEFEGLSEWKATGLSRPWLLTLSEKQRLRALAQYLWLLNVRDFRQTQLQEVSKYLDNPQVMHRFRIAGCDWHFNAGQIQAVPCET